MLPESLRYNLRQDAAFFQRARSLKSPFWTLLWAEAATDSVEMSSSALPNQPAAPLRFAIIVKRTVASGVQRTKLKRLVRSAIVEALRSPLPPKQRLYASYAVVILPRRAVFAADPSQLSTSLRDSLSALP